MSSDPRPNLLNIEVARESQQCFELKNIELTVTIPVTPTTVRKLLDKGFKVNLERNPVKIFEDEEFKDAGATFVKEGSWPDAPQRSHYNRLQRVAGRRLYVLWLSKL